MEEFVTLQIGRSTWQGLKKDCAVTMTHDRAGWVAIDTAELKRLAATIPAGPWIAASNHPTNACAHVLQDAGWSLEIATLYGNHDDVPTPCEGEPWGDMPIRDATAEAISYLPALIREVLAHRKAEASVDPVIGDDDLEEEWKSGFNAGFGEAKLTQGVTEIEQLTKAHDTVCGALAEAIKRAEKAEAERDANAKWLGELLAVIHRDGGHYQSERGNEKAVAEAHRIVARLITERDEALARVSMAYEMAADACADYPVLAPCEEEWIRYDRQIEHSQKVIRTLPPADSQAALYKLLSQARMEGWRAGRDAAAIAANWDNEGELFNPVQAIRALPEPKDANNDD